MPNMIIVIRAIFAAREALQFANNLLTYGQINSRLDEINTKLDVVIRNQQAILLELSQIGFRITDALRERDAKQLESIKDQADIALASPLASANRAEYERIAYDLRVITGVLGRYGPEAAVAYLGGMAGALTFSSILDDTPERRARILSVMIKPIQHWLNASDRASLPAMIAALRTTISDAQQSITNKSRRYHLEHVTEYADPGWVSYDRVLYVDGDFQAGFRGRVEQENRRRFGGRGGPLEARAAGGGSRVLARGLETAAAAFSAIPPEIDARSPHHQVNWFVDLRNETIRNMHLLEGLVQLERELSATEQVLAPPAAGST